CNRIDNEIFGINEKLEEFKTRMDWKEEELEEWTLASKQKEEDQMALEKYKRMDEVKVRQLNVILEQTSRQCGEAKKSLEKEITETKSFQMQLDNAAEEFKILHQERIQIIDQWDSAVRAINSKDEIIVQIANNVSNLQKIANEKNTFLQTQNQSLNEKDLAVKQLQTSLAKLLRELEKAREYNQKTVEMTAEKANELALMENELEKLEEDQKKMANDISRMKSYQEVFDQKFAKKQQQLKSLELKHDYQIKNFKQMEHTAKEADEGQKKTIERKTCETTTQLHVLKEQESSLQHDIHANKAAVRNLQSKIQECDQKSMKQQEALYCLEFQIQQLERKISRAQGKKSQEETAELNEKLIDLQTKLKDQKKHETELQTQVKRFEDDLRLANKNRAVVNNNKEKLNSQISEHLLINESIESEIKQLMKQQSELLLVQNDNKLSVIHLRDELNVLSKKVFAAKNDKMQLELIMEERKNEIENLNKINMATIKVKESARKEAQMDLKKCETKLYALQSKYCTVAGKLRTHEEEQSAIVIDNHDETAHEESPSPIQLMIQLAQEREELKQKGDSLDAIIQQSEQDIVILHQSLKHLNDSNTNYRLNMNNGDSTSPEGHLKNELENKYRILTDNLYQQKKKYLELDQDVNKIKNEIDILNKGRESLDENLTQYRQTNDILDHTIQAQYQKISRAQKTLDKLTAQINNNISNERQLQNDLKELKVAMLKRKHNVILSLLQFLATEFPELSESVANTLKSNHINFNFDAKTSRKSTPLSQKSLGSVASSRPNSMHSVNSQASKATSVINLKFEG
ncbi:hypothetical protein RFI_22300, partial [Reticulomyxa filosa]